LRRYKENPRKEIVDQFVTEDGLKFIQYSIQTLDKKPAPYDVALVYEKLIADQVSLLKAEDLRTKLTKLNEVIHTIKEGHKPGVNDVDSVLQFLVTVIPEMDNAVADLGKKLYGSWIDVREGT
jgi:hypothetical protein